jgi:RimJ/RimL family protein N-acetyltransferase
MNWEGFDPQPTLEGRSLRLRPLASADLEALYTAASDPEIWEQHPAHTRHERTVFETYFDRLLSTGTALAIESKSDGRVIGTSSYYSTSEDPPARSIGFTFLERAYWGGTTNFELKTLMLDHLLAHFDVAWFHVNLGNIRSQKATAKLGAVPEPPRLLDLGNGPSDYVCFKLTRDAWNTRKAEHDRF